MTDESAETGELFEAPTPGRSMTGAAEDLSSLFGDEASRDPGATALGPRRTPVSPSGDVSAHLSVLSQRLTKLEEDLAEAVARVQGVDRHLATTFQGLQAIFDKLQESPGPATEVASGFAALGERLGAVETQLKAPARPDADLSSRLAAIELTLASAVERLGGLEGRVSATLEHVEAGREAIAGLERSLADQPPSAPPTPPPPPPPAPEAPPDVPAGAPGPWTVQDEPEAQPELTDLLPDAGPPAPPPPDESSASEPSAGEGSSGEPVAQPEALYWTATSNEGRPSLTAPAAEPPPDTPAEEPPPRPEEAAEDRPEAEPPAPVPFWRPAEPPG